MTTRRGFFTRLASVFAGAAVAKALPASEIPPAPPGFNPYIDWPKYYESLQGLDPQTREALLNGYWPRVCPECGAVDAYDCSQRHANYQFDDVELYDGTQTEVPVPREGIATMRLAPGERAEKGDVLYIRHDGLAQKWRP